MSLVFSRFGDDLAIKIALRIVSGMQVVALTCPTPTKTSEDRVHEFTLGDIDRSQQHTNGPTVDGVHEATASAGVVGSLDQIVLDGLKRRRAVPTAITMGVPWVVTEAVNNGYATAQRELNDSHWGLKWAKKSSKGR